MLFTRFRADFLPFLIIATIAFSPCNAADTLDFVFDVSSYNASNDSEFIIKQYVNITTNITQGKVINVPQEVSFMVLEAHSFYEEITFHSEVLQYPISGYDIGYIMVNEENSVDSEYGRGILITKPTKEPRQILLVLRAYNSSAPIPGGCNNEFPEARVAPFQKVNASNPGMVEVMFKPPMIMLEPCEENLGEISVFHYLFEPTSDEKGHFDIIEKFISFENITKYGRKVETAHRPPPYRKYYNSYDRLGSVFAAVARYNNISVPYISVVSYFCEPTGTENSCHERGGTFWSWLLGVLLFTGLYITFTGHKLISFTLFFVGFILGGLIISMILPYGLGTSGILDLTLLTVMGVSCGVLLLYLWIKTASPVVSVMPTFFIAGFLVSSIIFYSGLGDMHVYMSDLNYWGTFLCVALVVVLVLTIVTLPGSIVASSLIGSFAAIVPIDHYVGSHVRHLLLTPIRRATIPHFNEAVIDPPFFTPDICIVVLWATLAIAGAWVQRQTSKNRAPFPNPIKIFMANESTPLLSENQNRSTVKYY